VIVALHFAHLTDVHISEKGESWGTLGGDASRLLQACCERLNEIDDLDFALITGDVVDGATTAEIESFRKAMSHLDKPWHFIPGNHDGFIDPRHPEALRPSETVSLLDPRLADLEPDANRAYWSRAVAPGVQLIGLDSRMATDWAGVINPAQFDWLGRELDTHRSDLVLIAIHHPLHDLGPHNERTWWDKFTLTNAQVLERLLDQHANIKMVLTGHHHANQIMRRNERLHLSTASLSGYPCSYRAVRIENTADEGWRVTIDTHTIADEETLEQARIKLLESDTAGWFEPGHPEAWVAFCAGTPPDQHFDGVLD
jgi:3',5'-cyclic AMP phosphodiesterase CpdA